MKKALLKITNDYNEGRINKDILKRLMYDLLEMNKDISIPLWLDREDVEIARLYYRNGLKLQAVKHINDFAREHIEGSALRWSKEFVESLEY
jgi:hypothetical protein